MTWSCTPCDLNRAPYMTVKGACPKCGGGTVRSPEGISPGAGTELLTIKTAGSAKGRHKLFEDYYTDREKAATTSEPPRPTT